VLITAVFGGVWFWGWQEVRDDVLASDSYTLSPKDIVVANQAEWIRVDIREEVFRDASLQQRLSIMDPTVNERVAAAFSLHPWVAKVRRVDKRHPAGVTVELEYHRPVCMVNTYGRLIPVDVNGIVLPMDDIARSVARRYPRLDGVNTTPNRPVGTQWGDLRVIGAAEIAGTLGNRWQTYHLEKIVPVVKQSDHGVADILYDLYTRSGSIVAWGHAPGMNAPAEPTAAEKIAYLDRIIERYGTLEGKDEPQEIDLLFHLRNRSAALPGRTLAK
jgi:hypothetical protein